MLQERVHATCGELRRWPHGRAVPETPDDRVRAGTPLRRALPDVLEAAVQQGQHIVGRARIEQVVGVAAARFLVECDKQFRLPGGERQRL